MCRHMYTHMSALTSIHMPAHMSAHLSIQLSAQMPTHMSTHMSTHMFIYRSMSPVPLWKGPSKIGFKSAHTHARARTHRCACIHAGTHVLQVRRDYAAAGTASDHIRTGSTGHIRKRSTGHICLRSAVHICKEPTGHIYARSTGQHGCIRGCFGGTLSLDEYF